MKTMMQRRYYIESSTGQRHDRVQTESQELQPWTAPLIRDILVRAKHRRQAPTPVPRLRELSVVTE